MSVVRSIHRRLLVVAAVSALMPTMAAGSAPALAGDSVRTDDLGAVSVHASDLSAFPLWRDAVAVFESWLPEAMACLEARCGDLSLVETVWLNHVRGLSRLPADAQARRVVGFLRDLLEGQPDAPASPRVGPWPTMPEILAGSDRGGLALALARYYSLRAAGLDPSALRVVMARDTLTLETTHVVLIETAAHRIAMTRYGMEDLDRGGRLSFVPLYAVNHAGRWLYFPKPALADDATSSGAD
jgi:hypothetical protein